MDQKINEEIEIDVKELFFILLHKCWIILLIGIVGAISVGVIHKLTYVPIYASTAKLYVINRQNEDRTTFTDLQTGWYLTKDLMILVKSRPVTEQVISDLDLNMTHEQLAGLVTVNTPQDTRILEISVAHTDPEIAKQLADALAEVSSERLVTVMEMKKVNIVEEGNIPKFPFNYNLKRNILLGAIIGVFLSSFIIILFYVLDDSIQTTEDIEKYLGISALGSIPIAEGTTKKKHKSRDRKRKAILV